jgi:hypothetical protein
MPIEAENELNSQKQRKPNAPSGNRTRDLSDASCTLGQNGIFRCFFASGPTIAHVCMAFHLVAPYTFHFLEHNCHYGSSPLIRPFFLVFSPRRRHSFFFLLPSHSAMRPRLPAWCRALRCTPGSLDRSCSSHLLGSRPEVRRPTTCF